MSLSQPGGFSAWLRATRIEATGAARSTSVLDHAAAGATNLGTFAGFTVVALAPLALAALAGRGRPRCPGPGWQPERHGPPARMPRRRRWRGPAWARPWYQSRTAVLAAAIVPPVLLVALVQFAKGGYLLAYLPAAVIALLLPLAALNRRAPGRVRRSSTGVADRHLGRRRGHRRRSAPSGSSVGTGCSPSAG